MERVSNQFSHAARLIVTEKVSPVSAVKDQEFLKNMEQQKEKKQHEVTKEKMEEVVKGINDFIHPASTSIKFELHDRLNDYYVTVIDDNTKEVIKEIPSKKLLDLYADMMEFVGILVDRKI
nr:flagellar protein FlaG [uncultured Bacillus sp.]